MEKNYKILKVGLIIILVTLIISIGIAYYLKLDRPVFLKSYIERRLPTDEGHNLYPEFYMRYITNADDIRVVNYIEFEEYPDLYVNASEYNQSGFQFFNKNNTIPGQKVGRYSVRDIYLTIDASNIENKDEDIRLTKAKVHFSDGDVEEVDIGELILYPDDNINRQQHFDQMMVRGSNDGTNTTQEKVNEPIELVKMESEFLDQFQDFIDIKVGGMDYKDIEGKKYEAGEYLNIDSVFRTPEDLELSMYNYDIKPKLHYKDREGNNFIYRLHNLDYRKHGFEFFEIIKFLRARGEL